MRQRSGEVVGRGRVVSFRFCFLFFIHNSCSLLSSVQRPALMVRRGPSVVGAAADSATQRWCGCRGARGVHTTAAHGRRRQAVRGVVRFLFVLLFWVQSHLTSCSSFPLAMQEKRRPWERGTGQSLNAACPWQVERVAHAVPAGPLHRRQGSEEGAPILPSPSSWGRWDKESALPAPSSLVSAEGRPCDPSGPVERRGTPRDDRRWR